MRGFQRKIIHLKNTGSYLFDEAYFVISKSGEELHMCEDDMVKEATRIIEEEGSISDGCGFFVRNRVKIISLLIGTLFGAATASLLFILI